MPELQEKVREQPYASPYSVKARALIYASMARIDLPANTLLKDKNTVVKKCPFLLNEMINSASTLIGMCNNGYIPKRKLAFAK